MQRVAKLLFGIKGAPCCNRPGGCNMDGVSKLAWMVAYTDFYT